MNTKSNQSNLRLFELAKDVKSYDKNFFEIVGIILGWACCPYCGNSSIKCWSAYLRKKAGVRIQRFKCKKCNRTFSWLPPFLLPRKHYTIPEIEPDIEEYLKGSTGYWKLEDLACSLGTIRRWIDTLALMAPELFKTARKNLVELKSNFKFEKDKRLSAADFPSAHSEIKNHNLNLLYQVFILREYFSFLVKPEDFLVWLVFQFRMGHKKTSPTRFGDDRNGIIRNNSP